MRPEAHVVSLTGKRDGSGTPGVSFDIGLSTLKDREQKAEGVKMTGKTFLA